MTTDTADRRRKTRGISFAKVTAQDDFQKGSSSGIPPAAASPPPSCQDERSLLLRTEALFDTMGPCLNEAKETYKE